MTIEEKIKEHNSKYKVQLTKQMVRYVKRTHGKKNFTQMRKYLGLSACAFHRLACIAGIDNRSREEVTRRIVEEYAPYMTFKEMSEKFGRDKSEWAYLARKYGVESSREKQERIVKQRRETLNMVKQKEGHWNRFGEIIRKRWRMEYFRVSSGMPQKTKLHLREIGGVAYKRIFNYIRHRGYIQDENDFKTLYFDENTKRSRLESKMVARYKIRIFPITEKKG